jgi:hypothetical protein
MTKEFDIVDELVNSFDAKVGFPGFRVFIYGKEVTSDVINVSVNNNGGSIERSPGTCTITLYNPSDRYVINQSDIKSIANAQKVFFEKYPQVAADLLLTDVDIWGEDLASDAGDFMSVEQLLEESSSVYVQDSDVYLDKASVEVLYVDLIQNPQNIERTLAGLGFTDLTPASSTAIARRIIEKYELAKKPLKLRLNPVEDLFGTTWGLKSDVVKSKLKQVSFFANDKDPRAATKVSFSYPYQQGDCIFHFNDPVRVVFRDPFNPNQWYWKFSGFIDTFTESQGVNKDSRVTLTCTDVSKVPRYSTVALSGLLDFNDPFQVDGLLSPSERTEQNAGLQFYQEAFKDLTILEILETIFFGSESASDLVEESINDQILNLISALWDESDGDSDFFYSYISSISNLTVDQINRALNPDDVTQVTDAVNGIKDNKKRVSILKEARDTKLQRLDSLSFSGIRNPRNVSFTKKSQNRGVNFYVYGEPDFVDVSREATQVKSLFEWNEVIHHRVRAEDLLTMLYGSSDSTVDTIDKDTVNIDDVISTIGKDIENYPVGGGSVYLLSPAGVESSFLEFGVVLRDFGSIGMHSTFRDRLSYIYDLAEGIDFRFYATPKGDLVFEIPMYDFDPDEFWNRKDITDDQLNRYLSGFSYTDIFQKDYDGVYENIDDLMNNVIVNSAIDILRDKEFEYKKEFTISLEEQLGFSNTSTDNGLLTAFRIMPKLFSGLSETDDANLKRYQVSSVQELIPVIGLRVGEGNPWSFVDTPEGAKLLSQLQLNRVNAEARNISVKTLPKFGLMVNRPIFWSSRNFYANIVSVSDSITWHGDVSTEINLNQVRGWSGTVKDGKPFHKHFGNTDRPFNYAEFIKQAIRRVRDKAGAE